MKINTKTLFFIAIAFIVFTFIFNLLSNNSTNNNLEMVKIGYKERWKTGELKKMHTFDTINNIYKNLYYKIAFEAPKNWKSDLGIGQNIIYRTFDKEKGINLSIIVNEFKKKPNYRHSYGFYLDNKEKLENVFKKGIEKGVNSKIYNFKVTMDYIRNIVSTKIVCNYKIKSTNEVTEFQSITHTIYREKFMYSINIALPLETYKSNSSFYDHIFNNIYFL